MNDPVRVLHVDNDPDFAALAATFLERADERLRVETTTGADEGLDLLAAGDFDCVVSDYEMPERNGIEFLEAVRETEPGMPFILFTGSGSEAVASEAISRGVTDYLQKTAGTKQYELLANRVTNVVAQTRSKRRADEMDQLLCQLTEATNDVLWMFSHDWSELLFVNSAYEDIWGRTVEALRERPAEFLDGIHPDDQELVGEAMETLSAGESVDIEYRVEGGDGVQRWAWVQGEPIFDEAGEVVRIAGFVRDVTDRKRREQQLQETRDRMEFALATTNSLIWDADFETSEIVHYPHARTLYQEGVETVEEFLSRVHPEDREDVEDAIREAYKTGEYEAEFRIVHEGEDRWIADSGRFEFDAEGMAVAGTGTAQDITERKKHERAIKDLHDTARELMQAQAVDEVADIVVEAIYRILGLPINGIWFHDEHDDALHPAASAQQATAAVGGFPSFRSGESIAWEVFESGESRWYDDVSTASGCANPDTVIRSEMLLPVGEYGVIVVGSTEVGVFDDVDVSVAQTVAAHAETAIARLEREQELREEREFVDQALNTLDDLFYVVGADGETQRWNNRFLEVTGYTDEEIDGMNASEFFPADDRKRILAAIQETMDHGRTSTEADLLTADGDHIPYEFVGARLTDTSGEFIGLVGVGRDVTERKAYEEKLERQNEHLSEFADIVSHDLRNPLSVAMGRLELARAEYEGEHLDYVARAHDRMETLISDLLALAREGQRTTDIESVSLTATAEDGWLNVQTAHATLNTVSNPVLRADPGRLQQLLENLFRNAVEHGGDETTVTIGELDDGTGFYVSDDGPGIPVDSREKLFETGYSTRRDESGFGLLIVQQIADAHGWTVSVTESATGGARFELTGVEFVQ